jgi:hypothetical protein
LAHTDVDLIRYSWPGEERVNFVGERYGYRQFGVVPTTRTNGWCYGDDPHLQRSDFTVRHGWYLETCPHGVSEGVMLYQLRNDNAVILAADRIYFGHFGVVPAVIHDVRPGTEHLRDE